jgi:asparagine synthase (glutamine-hydrolysing)
VPLEAHATQTTIRRLSTFEHALTLRSIVAGSPCFADADLAHTERADGGLAAWRQAMERPAVAAAASAQGHFAAAISEGGRALLAVDRFATQTLCFRFDDQALHFAQRADALAGPVPKIDPQALFDYLYFHDIPSPRTIFEGVRRLPPGTARAWRTAGW